MFVKSQGCDTDRHSTLQGDTVVLYTDRDFIVTVRLERDVIPTEDDTLASGRVFESILCPSVEFAATEHLLTVDGREYSLDEVEIEAVVPADDPGGFANAHRKLSTDGHTLMGIRSAIERRIEWEQTAVSSPYIVPVKDQG